MFWEKIPRPVSIRQAFIEYFLLNRYSEQKRTYIQEITPDEILKKIEKLSLKQREHLGMYGIV